jgi:hypothetical protein
MSETQPSQDQMTRLEFAFKVRAYHHNAIWEEQKHFTWFMSILLSAQLLALTSDRIETPTKALVTSLAAFVGVTLAATGFRVQRREGEFFRNANELYIAQYNSTFPELRISVPPRWQTGHVHGDGVRDDHRVDPG